MNKHISKSKILSGFRNISHGFLNRYSNEYSGDFADQNNLSEIIKLEQIHSDNVHVIERSSNELRKGDSIITDLRGLGIGVYTADCVPILLYDRVNIVVAAVHAGWKGSLLNILEKSIKSMKSQYNTRSKDIYAVIGPCICRCCYEVKDDVASRFIENYSRADNFLYSLNGSKYNLDLKKFNSMVLEENGVINIEVLDKCTKCDFTYYSYRREGKGVGSQLSFIGISN